MGNRPPAHEIPDSPIHDPGRFKSSKAAGAHFGLTPRRYQSGETDVTGRISKIGGASVRTALYEAANVILTRPVKGSSLKSWAMRVAKRAGMRKAKVGWRASSPLSCTGCWLTGPGSQPTRPLPPHKRGEITSSGGHKAPVARSRSRRRDDGSGQTAKSGAARKTTARP